MTSHAHKGRLLRQLRDDHGVTLIELLVVIAILGLLAAVVTPQVISYLDRAKVSTARSQITNIATALDLFKLDVGRYPTNEEGIGALTDAPTSLDRWNGPYLKKTGTLLDPWGNPFQYRFPGQHGEYDVYSFGPNGPNGGKANGAPDEQPIASWQ